MGESEGNAKERQLRKRWRSSNRVFSFLFSFSIFKSHFECPSLLIYIDNNFVVRVNKFQINASGFVNLCLEYRW